MRGWRNEWVAWPLAGAAMLAGLLWPAIYNGYPVVFYDTGGYLVSAIDGVLVPGRSALYGALLALTIPLDFWPVIVAQALIDIWLIALVMRVNGLGGRPWLTAAIVLALAALTSLAFYTTQLMPDVLVPVAVLALYLLAFRLPVLRRWEAAVAGAITAYAIAGHMSIMALALGLIVFLGLLRLVAPVIRFPRPRLAAPALAVAAGVALSLLSNFAIAHRFAFTPGGPSFIFGRLVQDGIVQRYLADNCPDATLRLCDHRDALPGTADEWLWDDPSPLKTLGGWEGYEDEATRIIGETLTLYPWMHVTTAVKRTVEQFLHAETGDGITPWMWYVHWAIKTYAPSTAERFMAAREQNEIYPFYWLNGFHNPVWAFGIIALPILIVARRRVRPAAATLCAIVLVALIGNAAICGIFSNPHDRYQSRLAPLAPLAAVIALLTLRRPERRGPSSA